MNDLFHIIDDAQVILRSKGVFRQAKVYRRGDRLYAGWGSGFIRLGGRDATSCPNVSYEALSLPDDIKLTRGTTGEPVIDAGSLLRQVAAIRAAA